MKTLTIIILFGISWFFFNILCIITVNFYKLDCLCFVLSGGDRYLAPLKLMQHGEEMFVFGEETEATEVTEVTESDITFQDIEITEETNVLALELITPAEKSNGHRNFAPTCDNALYYGSESCSLDCPANGWKLELDAAGCCCFFFERESNDDLELVYSEFWISNSNALRYDK